MSVDRVTGGILLLAALFYGLEAQSFETGFIADPIGPQAFPGVLGAVLGGLSLWLLFHPDDNPSWPSKLFWWRWVVVIAALMTYAVTLPLLGFVVSTSFLILFLSMLFGARFSRGAIVAVTFSAVSYLVFGRLLSIALPPGSIFFGGN